MYSTVVCNTLYFQYLALRTNTLVYVCSSLPFLKSYCQLSAKRNKMYTENKNKITTANFF